MKPQCQQIQGRKHCWYEGGAGKPLILFPGFGESNKTLLQLGRQLAAKYRVFLPETPGFGDEAPLPLPEYAYSAQVQRLQGLFRHWGLQRFSLGGSSAGGHLACLYALAQPQQIESLILLAPQGLKTPDSLPYADKTEPTNDLADFERLLTQLYHQPPKLSPEVKLRQIKKIQARFERLNQIRKVIRSEDFIELNSRLPKLAQPTLLLWGRQDQRIPIGQAPLWQKQLPHCTFQSLENCGHVPQIEKTTGTAELILRFLSSPPSL